MTGIACTQFGGGSSKASASISISGPNKITGAAGSTPVNLTTEGLIDWYTIINSTDGIAAPRLDSAVSNHAKVLGGWLRRGFKWFGPVGTVTFSNNAASVFGVSSSLGDDDCLSGIRLANLVTGVTIMPLINANNALAFNGWGWRLEAPGSSKVNRTLNIYFGFSSGGAATNNQLQITARVADGTAADQIVNLSPGAIGFAFYKMTIVYRTASFFVPLIVAASVIQNSGDTSTQVGFQAATLQ